MLGPIRAVVSWIDWASRGFEDDDEVTGRKVHISVTEAANWRISELMSCTACSTCAPDQLSIRVM